MIRHTLDVVEKSVFNEIHSKRQLIDTYLINRANSLLFIRLKISKFAAARPAIIS